MAEASQLFSQKANDYRSGRTHYPKAIASILRALELPGNKAVDAGCGTGIFSQLLLDCGFTVYGVEPNAEMLCAASGRDSAARPFGGLYLCGTILPLV